MQIKPEELLPMLEQLEQLRKEQRKQEPVQIPLQLPVYPNESNPDK